MPQSAPTWTAAQVRLLPQDGNRYEVVGGELLVTPAPFARHQRALRELFIPLNDYLTRTGLGEILWSPADIEFDSRTLVQPDLFVLPLVDGRELPNWEDITTLLLAIEVLSPITARYDRLTKRRLYQRQGVEYWIADLDARVIERWVPHEDRPQILAERLEWGPPGANEPLVIDLERFFEKLWT